MFKTGKKTIFIASFLMAGGIILGAFGAHALADTISEHQMANYKTGVLYHYVHALALFGIGIMYRDDELVKYRTSAYLFFWGIILFSGSLYLLSTQMLTGIPSALLGPLTPLGGISFIFGWCLIAYQTVK